MKHRVTNRPKTAYIFGGMEAFILQGLLGGILGGALVLKGYWRRIKAYFSGTPEQQPTHASVESEPSDDTR